MALNSTCEPNLDPGILPLGLRLGVFFMIACAVALAVLGVFEAGTEECGAKKDLPAHLSHCISRVKDTTVVLSLTGIAITVAAFTQAIQAAEAPTHGASQDPRFTLFHVYMTLNILAVISIVGSWSLIHCQLLYMSIKRDSDPNKTWLLRFVELHSKWTFGWWCHHIQLLTMASLGVYAVKNYDKFIPLPECAPHWAFGSSARDAAKAIYIMLLLPILNNILFGLPSFLLAVLGARIYLAQADERPWSLFHTPLVENRTIYRVIMGFWGVGMVLMVIPLAIVIEVIFSNNIKNSNWDFGSIYAIALVLVPLQSVIKSVFRVLPPNDPQPKWRRVLRDLFVSE